MRVLSGIQPKHIAVSFLAIGGIVSLVLFSFPNNPNLDNFVLFASDEIKLEKEAQISSGDLGSNKEIDIQKDVIINGNLFADKITIDKNTIINGNASYNVITLKQNSQILGTQTKPISLPIANFPEIPDFQIGTQDFNFKGENNTLSAGNYRDITLEKNSRLILSGGVYNIRKLEFKENSIIIFTVAAVINIEDELKAQEKVSIFAGQNTRFDDLQINLKDKNPIHFGKNSFLNFKLIAPKSDVRIGEETILRGQILAKKIKIEKGSILSRELGFIKDSDPEKVIINAGGGAFSVNEIIVNFNNNVTFLDAQMIADVIGGRITGFLEFANAYQIEVAVNMVEELEAKIETIENLNNSLIEGVFENFILQLE